MRRELIDRFGADTTNQGGLVVRTTIDPALQLVADRALRAAMGAAGLARARARFDEARIIGRTFDLMEAIRPRL